VLLTLNDKFPEWENNINIPVQNSDKSEDRFKLLSEAAFEGICIHDHGIILDANQQFCDMFGYTLDEIKGMVCFNLIPPEFHEMVKGYIATGFQGPYVTDALRKDATIFPVEVRAREFQRDDKNLRIAVFRDLTTQKEMERKIAESEKRYRVLYNHSPIALYRTRISDGKLLECNRALVKLFGYDSKGEFQASSNAVSRYANIDDRAVLLEKLKKDNRVKGFQVQVTRKDGEAIWIEATAEIFPEQGYMEGAMQDITASKVLTPAEKKVLRLVVEGMGNKQVARILKRSVRTIEDHRSRIMQKLGVDNLPDLVRKAKTLRPEA
jgi:PAS domain S-box-containing protein